MVGVTHSAASQTAAQMARHGLLTLEAELPAALTHVLQAAERAVLSRSMRTRIADAARTLALEHAPAADEDTAPGPERRAALLAIAGQAPGKPR